MSKTVKNSDLRAFFKENRDPEIKNVVFNACDFSNLNLSHRTFIDTHFDACNFDAATFYKSHFINTDFRGPRGETVFSGPTGCDYIGYKCVLVKDEDGYDVGAIAKLLIPASATAVGGFSVRFRTHS